MSVGKYRQRCIERVEAIQYDGTNLEEIHEFAEMRGAKVWWNEMQNCPEVTPAGDLLEKNDWVVWNEEMRYLCVLYPEEFNDCYVPDGKPFLDD